jgi:ferrochelatase
MSFLLRRRRVVKQAVLLLAHGTPESVEEIPDYLRNVTGGRPLPEPVVHEVERRYRLIGHSPLTEITRLQGQSVEAELVATGEPVPVYVAMRNWKPYIADVLRQMKDDGVTEAAVICLAPQNSRTSVGLYRRAVEAEAGEIKLDFTESWETHPLLIAAFAERLRVAYEKLSAEVGAPVPVLFTAHSVPARTLEPREGQPADPYVEHARATASLVAALVPEIPLWWFAFQSQGASGGVWIGPTVEESLQSIAGEGVKTLLLQPIGFLCDHVEILYDIDIHFREEAAKLGMRLERPESLNDAPLLAKAVAGLACAALRRLRTKGHRKV